MNKSKIIGFFIGLILVGTIRFFITGFNLDGKKSEKSTTDNQEKQNQSDSSTMDMANVNGAENELTKSDSTATSHNVDFVQQSIPYSFYDRVHPPLKATYLPVCCSISYGQMAKK